MFFSVEYPEIMERVEEKLKKQVEDKGFDFEAIKKIVGASIARLSVSKNYNSPIKVGFQRALPFGGVQRQRLWQGVGQRPA
ncbi:MAG: hypothetical protein IKJ60_00200 [Ruminococcus sp.]|nr:hypothetical protein [Ruminococcus sp.]MBR3899952.1 hypothetical protein [Ruminococcus sp.]